MKDHIFAEGFIFEKPREGSPDFVKGRLGIVVKEAIKFLQKYENERGFVNLDLKKSKDGQTLYLELNTWKPNQPEQKVKEEAKNQEAVNKMGEDLGVGYPETEEEINPDDIPF